MNEPLRRPAISRAIFEPVNEEAFGMRRTDFSGVRESIYSAAFLDFFEAVSPVAFRVVGCSATFGVFTSGPGLGPSLR